jgi:hypothetical protein
MEAPLIANGAGLVTLITASSNMAHPDYAFHALYIPMLAFSIGGVFGFFSLMGLERAHSRHSRLYEEYDEFIQDREQLMTYLDAVQDDVAKSAGKSFKERRSAQAVARFRLGIVRKRADSLSKRPEKEERQRQQRGMLWAYRWAYACQLVSISICITTICIALGFYESGRANLQPIPAETLSHQSSAAQQPIRLAQPGRARGPNPRPSSAPR